MKPSRPVGPASSEEKKFYRNLKVHVRSQPLLFTRLKFDGRRWKLLISWVLGIVTTVLLHLNEAEQGYVRDEGIYFEASRQYAAWLRKFGTDPLQASSHKNIKRYFSVNHEHPALMKLLAGQSANLFAQVSKFPQDTDKPDKDRPSKKSRRKSPRHKSSSSAGVWPIMREGAAMRLPTQILSGVATALLMLFGWNRWGCSAGILAAGCFMLLPRVAFHANLHCFDIAIAVAGIVVTFAYLRALRNPSWGIALGPILGIAISIKHNALFFPILFFAHYILCLQLSPNRARQTTSWIQYFPLPFVSMALLAPLTVWLLWPWLWHETGPRWLEYLEFHRHHSYYNMEFLGANFNRPPLPIAYPWTMTWATVPTTVLLLATAGLIRGVRQIFNQSEARRITVNSWARPLAEHHQETVLFGILALFPLVLISLPEVPIFGGTKHWLTAYPFIALLAASAWAYIWSNATLIQMNQWTRIPLKALTLILILIPGTYSVVHGHGLNLSQYSPFVGGARGAARLGLNRGFWGYAGVSDFLSRDPNIEGKLYLHDLHPYAQKQYVRENRWPKSISHSPKIPLSRASAALLFHEKHMIRDEVKIWNRMKTTVPTTVWCLDDVPLTSLYSR